jgi:hypothetical protein
MYRNIESLLRAHPLPWKDTHDDKGKTCVKDANGVVVLYPQGNHYRQIADAVAAVFTYHAEEEPV